MCYVLRDTQEQLGWRFAAGKYCSGTKDIKLPTGDYTLEGYENIVIIERKGTTGEFAKNICEKRFEREMARLEHFTHPFIVCEFTMEHIMKFPLDSGIPVYLWRKLRVNKSFLLKRFLELQMSYKTKIILAGIHGKTIAASIFKEILRAKV